MTMSFNIGNSSVRRLTQRTTSRGISPSKITLARRHALADQNNKVAMSPYVYVCTYACVYVCHLCYLVRI
jgi:hypothetical protein